MKKYLVYGLSLILTGSSAWADAAYTNHFVWTNSPDAGSPYNAWTNAAHDIQTAVNWASPDDTVWATNGLYTNSLNGKPSKDQVTITKRLTLRSVNGAAVTIIDGISTNRCILMTNTGTVVDGFTLRNGCMTNTSADLAWGSGAGGIYITGGTLRNSTITGNRAQRTEPSGTYYLYGGGIYATGTGLVENCIISGNLSRVRGGGAYLTGQSTMQYCQVAGNIAELGGGVAAVNSTIRNCVIASNKSENCGTGNGTYYGGGIICNGSVTIQNCLIYTNTSAVAGGGIWIEKGCAATVQNCTIVFNYAANGSVGGGGVCLIYSAPGGATGIFANTIIDLNYAPVKNGVRWDYAGSVNDASFTNCLLQVRADVAGAKTNAYCLFGSTSGFIDTNAGNFRLLKTSPCLNTGSNETWITRDAVDLAGNLRLRFGRVDMGAYEWYPGVKVNGIPYEKIRLINGAEPSRIDGCP